MNTIYEMDSVFKKTPIVTINMGMNISFKFDCKNLHERYYVGKLLTNYVHPLSDIDDNLYKLVIKENDNVLDAGANIGFTTFSMLKQNPKQIVSLEPIPEIFDRLYHHFSNTFKVKALPYALSDTCGETKIIVSEAHNQGSTINEEIVNQFNIFGNDPKKIDIQTRTIDDLSKEYDYFDIWKLDIEGAEVKALDGAMQSLQYHPPRCIIAELYGDILFEFIDKVKHIYTNIYRCYMTKTDYRFILVEINSSIDENLVYRTSPMYLFSKEKMEYL